MTLGDHIERELLLLKLQVPDSEGELVRDLVKQQDARVLDDALANYTVEMTGSGGHLDEFIDRIRAHAEILAVVRSGPLSVARGQTVLGASL
jgi:acetolactate synthase-1/3 small subunit